MGEEPEPEPDKKLEVIEWPEKGSARRYPTGGWWVVETRKGRGHTPLVGPFRREHEADDALARVKAERT